MRKMLFWAKVTTVAVISTLVIIEALSDAHIADGHDR